MQDINTGSETSVTPLVLYTSPKHSLTFRNDKCDELLSVPTTEKEEKRVIDVSNVACSTQVMFHLSQLPPHILFFF